MCPVSTGGGTRRVRLVREEGRDVSSQYGREGGVLRAAARAAQKPPKDRGNLCPLAWGVSG